MSIARFVSRGKRSFSNILRFLDSVQKYKNSYIGKFENKIHLGQIIIENCFQGLVLNNEQLYTICNYKTNFFATYNFLKMLRHKRNNSLLKRFPRFM